MTDKPLLSVIVANYNNESYIRDCLDSILDQTYKPLEIIVSDDGSTDNSPQVTREYEKKYPGMVKGVFSPVNRGVARTRHDAVLQAGGQYITTLDSDDYYYNQKKLEQEMTLVLEYKKQKKDILAFSNIAFVKEDKTLLHNWGNSKNIKEGSIFEDIITRSCMIPRDFVMRKSIYFEIGGYDFKFKTHEDWDLKIRAARKYEFYYTGEAGTAYRRHSSGLSNIPYHIRTENLWKVFFKNTIRIPRSTRKTLVREFTVYMRRRDEDYISRLKTGESSLQHRLSVRMRTWGRRRWNVIKGGCRFNG